MKTTPLFLLHLALTLLAVQALASADSWPWDDWNHEILLDEGTGAGAGVRLRWSSLDSDWVTIELAILPQNGSAIDVEHVSFKIGPRRSRAGDKGAIESSKWSKDRLIVNFTAAVEAEAGGVYKLLGTYKESSSGNSTTTLRFRRKWSPEGKDSYAITDDTALVSWEYRRVGEGEDVEPPAHSGSKSVSFRVNGEHYVSLPIDEEGPLQGHGTARARRRPGNESSSSSAGYEGAKFKFWDAKTKNVVNGQSTLYLGGIVKFPDRASAVKNNNKDVRRHIVGFRPLLEHPARIHHMVVFECEPGVALALEALLNRPTVNFFSDVAPTLWFTHCGQYAFGWSVGGEGLMLPEGTGLPVQDSPSDGVGSGGGGAAYFLLQVHYDNPGRAIFEDTSGFRVYYVETETTPAPEPRPQQLQDSSFLFIEHRVTMFEVIPPGFASFTTSTVCTAECTRALFPPSGVTVTNVQLHAHQLAVAARVRHLRSGVELLPPLAADEGYDPNYQEQRTVNPPRRLLPGDEFVVECEYDSAAREQPTFGGIESEAEMCVAFLHYYPKLGAIRGSCNSQPEYNTFFDAFGLRAPSESAASPILEAAGFPLRRDNRSVDFPIPFDVPSMRRWTGSTKLGEVWKYVNVSASKAGAGVDADVKETGSRTMADFLLEYDWKGLEGAKKKPSLEERLYGRKHYAFCPGVLLQEFAVENPVRRRRAQAQTRNSTN